MNTPASVERIFDIEGHVTEVKPFGNGLINDTYRVLTEGDTPDYILQRINHNIFPDVEMLQGNLEAVTSHIRSKLEKAGEDDIDRKVLHFIPVKETGKTYWFDGESYWRLSRLIEDSVSKEAITPDSANDAGRAFGNFQAMLVDIDKQLGEVIPDFHNMEFRLRQLHEAVSNDAAGRVAEVKDLLDEIEKRADKMTEPEKMYREGRLPKRICHCDTKVNNILFDKEGKVLCVIDLDTVMPSFVFSDFGDFLRTSACSTPEDEPETDKIKFRMDIFKAFAEGYLASARSFLTQEELDWLPNSVALFPYMQAVRFLADYINGDTYYKIKYPLHNLVRTKAQLKMLEEVEKAMPEIEETIKNL